MMEALIGADWSARPEGGGAFLPDQMPADSFEESVRILEDL